MKKIYLIVLMVGALLNNAIGQAGLSNGTPSMLIDFSNTTVPGVGSNPSTAYTGAGFSPNPTNAGRLNSNAWAITGWTDGDLAFGGTNTTGDYARGATAIAVTTGGTYAGTGAPASPANPMLYMQIGNGDFEPGTITLRIQNNGTTNITALDVSYNIYVRNDQARSNTFNFSYSSNNSTYTAVGALDYATPAALDALGLVLVGGAAPSRSTSITGLNIIPGAFFYIRWSSAANGGSGSRDEIGLDDINLSATFSASVSGLSTITAGGIPAPPTLSSLINTSGAGATNFSFLVTDDGSVNDTDPTLINQIVINQGGNNHASLANWTQAILGAELSDGTNTVTGTINATNITFASLPNSGTTDIGRIADDANKTYTVKIWLRPALGGTLPLNIDGKQFEFLVQTSGITTESSGSSGIAASQSVASGAATNVVTVVATQLAWVQNTTTPTGLNTAMAPAVTITANDVNSNRDLDFVENIRITSTGTLSGSPVDAAAVSGLATFATLTHTVTGTGLTLNAERTTTLDWDITSNPFDIAVASSATDYFRSVASADWSLVTTWESSPDNATWIPATLAPDQNANTITIRTGHTVTASTAITADQVEIENGAVLNNTAGAFTVNDGTGNDVNIQAGGVFVLLSPAGPVLNSGATVNVSTNGILRVSRTGYTGNGSGVNAAGFVYQHASVLEYTLTSSFSASGVTFFPGVAAGTIPIFRTTAILTSVGGGSATVFNGLFEANGNITFTGAGTKTFRNGIIGTAAVVGSGSGKFIINGTTAILGGAGLLTLPTTDGLDIGTSTTVTMSSAKSVVGNIHLLANGMVELGNFDLNVLGDITGGSPTSYIRTNGTGMLNMLQIAAAKDFPVGNSTYNPISLNNPTGYDWKVRVEDNLTVSGPFVANVNRAVQRMWTITPSVVSPATTSEIFFHYNDGDPTQIGALFNTAAAVQVWHNDGNNWQTAEAPQTAGGTPGSDRTARLAAWSAFSKFAVANDGAVLPITLNYLNGTRQGSSNKLNWKVTCNSTPRVTLELQRGSDGQNFNTVVYSITADAVRCDQPFEHTDAQPLTGMNYYRLKMTDAYGKVTYSSILALLNRDKGFDVVSIAPNPVTDGRFKFNVTAAQSRMMDIRITDMSGRMMQTQRVSLIAGFNAIPVDASRLASGTYFIYGIVDGEGNSKPVRFVKQ